MLTSTPHAPPLLCLLSNSSTSAVPNCRLIVVFHPQTTATSGHRLAHLSISWCVLCWCPKRRSNMRQEQAQCCEHVCWLELRVERTVFHTKIYRVLRKLSLPPLATCLLEIRTIYETTPLVLLIVTMWRQSHHRWWQSHHQPKHPTLRRGPWKLVVVTCACPNLLESACPGKYLWSQQQREEPTKTITCRIQLHRQRLGPSPAPTTTAGALNHVSSPPTDTLQGLVWLLCRPQWLCIVHQCSAAPYTAHILSAHFLIGDRSTFALASVWAGAWLPSCMQPGHESPPAVSARSWRGSMSHYHRVRQLGPQLCRSVAAKFEVTAYSILAPCKISNLYIFECTYVYSNIHGHFVDDYRI